INAAGWVGVAKLVPPHKCDGARGAQVVGISGRMPVNRTIRLWSIAALFASAFVLGGCSTQIADMPGLGVPADSPERPKEAGGYLPVHDLPPDRNEEAIKPAE